MDPSLRLNTSLLSSAGRVGSVSEAATSTPSGRSNALTNKLTSILSASYADLDIKDALEALDARGVKNNADTRRNLRSDVQKDIIQCNADVIQDFGQVAKQLRSVGTALANLQITCLEMRRHISTARVETAPILDEANRLFIQKSAVETKQHLLRSFNAHFLLSETEVLALTSASEPLTDDFFHILVKAKRIHRDSQLLLGGENQRLGLEILDQSSRHLNAAFQKLHRWVQREFKSLDLENPQINASIRRALRVLAERKALFDGCLDAFAQARQRTLSDAFYAALTGVSGSDQQDRQKPIEFSAHEPLRYIGDMLAWAHATTVSERESLETLFIYEGEEIAKGIKEGLEQEPWRRQSTTRNDAPNDADQEEEQFDGRNALETLVSRNLSGVATSVRQRIEQVILSHDEPVLAYKIANLVRFYRNIFAKLGARAHGPSAPAQEQQSSLIDMLDGLCDAALQRFTATMRYQAATALGDQEHATVSEDLAPPQFLSDALDTLAALLASYDSSDSPSDPLDSGLDLIFAEALDPFLEACQRLTPSISTTSDTAIFTANCLLAATAILSNFPAFTTSKVDTLRGQVSANAIQLVASQHVFLLSTSGLDPLVAALETFSAEDVEALAHYPAFAPEALLAASQQLDAFLPHALMDAGLNLRRLKEGSMARRVTEEAASRFCEDFERVKEVIDLLDEGRVNGDVQGEDEDGVGGLREWFPRTKEEIRILLS